jgi:hypothetical protein
MRKFLVILLIPISLVLVLFQASWDTVAFFFSKMKEDLIAMKDEYLNYFQDNASEDDDPPDWWNYS